MNNAEEKQQEYIPEPQEDVRGHETGPPRHASRRDYHRERSRRDFLEEDSRHKSPVLAAVMSCMPGLGQIYVGYYQQGFIHVLVAASLVALLNSGLGALQPLAGFFLAFFWLYNVVDAARRATFYNRAIAGLGPDEIPEDMKMPGTRGSLVGGVVLIIAGAIAISYTRFGFSLDWLEEWWPVALFLVGGYLIYKHFANGRPGIEGEET